MMPSSCLGPSLGPCGSRIHTAPRDLRGGPYIGPLGGAWGFGPEPAHWSAGCARAGWLALGRAGILMVVDGWLLWRDRIEQRHRIFLLLFLVFLLLGLFGSGAKPFTVHLGFVFGFSMSVLAVGSGAPAESRVGAPSPL